MKNLVNVILIGCLLLSFHSNSHAMENITGIWEGTFNPKEHMTLLKKNFSVQPENNQAPSGLNAQQLISSLFFEQSLKSTYSDPFTSNRLKTKVYYEDNMVHFIDMTNSKINFLHFFDIPELLCQQGQNAPPSLQRLEFKLDIPSKKLNIPKKSCTARDTQGDQEGTISAQTTISLPVTADQNNKATYSQLLFNTILDVTVRTLSGDDAGKVEYAQIEIEFPLKRNTNPALWKPDEIKLLLTGLIKYPFYIDSFGGSTTSPVQRLADDIWGKNEDGYMRIMNYAFEVYGVNRPVPTLLNMTLPVTAQYDRTSVNNQITIGSKAFYNSLLYLVSTYIHEYTHSQQSWVSMWKGQREKEAYCIQKRWLQANITQSPKLNSHTLAELINLMQGSWDSEKKDNAWRTTYGDFNHICDGEYGLQRWPEIRAALQRNPTPAPNGRQKVNRDATFSPSTSGDQWEVILDY